MNKLILVFGAHTNLMKRIVLLFLLILTGLLLHAQQFPPAVKDARLGYKIIAVENNTWGYDIYNGTRLFVHQPTIPAIPGNKGFASKQFAEKVAKKVIEKIKKSESPPTITIDEMKQLGVIPK